MTTGSESSAKPASVVTTDLERTRRAASTRDVSPCEIHRELVTRALTMGVYTDPRLLDVAAALDVLPELSLATAHATALPQAR